MAKERLVAFGAGEVTPELIERSNLQKMKTGLRTLRNAMVTKFGGIKGRRGFVTLNNDVPTEAYPCAYYSIPEKGLLFMVTKKDVVVFENFNYDSYSFDEPIVSPIQVGDYYTEAELQTLHFTSDEKTLYIFCEGKTIVTVKLRPDFTTYPTAFLASFDPDTFVYGGGQLSYFATYPSTAPSGYAIEYAFTQVKNEIESFIVNTIQNYTHVAASLKLPQATNEQNDITIVYNKTGAPPQFTADEVPDEIRMYRRPKDSGAWGFVASAEPVFGGTVAFTIKDFGQEADFANQPPEYPTGFKEELGLIKPKTGIVYQNRLAITGSVKKNKVFASRTDAPDVMTRDFPLQDDSAVTLATGSDGGAKVGRMFDSRGLLITTTRGIYETPSDILKPDTAFAIKRSNVIHNDRIPVIGMGSSTLVADKRLTGVFKLVPAQGDSVNLDTVEISIFSAHLFRNKNIVSWTTQDDGTQILWMALDSGALIALSFQQDQQLESWSRHDTLLGNFKSMNVIETDEGHALIAVVEQNGTERIQVLSKQNLNVYEYIGTDGTVIFKNQMVATGQTVTWDPDAGTLTASAATFLNTAGLGAVDSVFRFFNFTTGEYVDLKVTAFTSTTVVEAELVGDIEFDDVIGSNVASEMYQTFTELTNAKLAYLNGLKVAVRADGFTHASPLNNDPNKSYLEYTVNAGSITLPEESRSAFVSVGLPIVTDIQNLSKDVIEAHSDREISEIVNRTFISYWESRGFYIGSEFPADNKVAGMDEHEVQYADELDSINPTKPIEPYSLKQEVVLNGDWQAGNSVALRNVDPQPVGIRGFILDVETGE